MHAPVLLEFAVCSVFNRWRPMMHTKQLMMSITLSNYDTSGANPLAYIKMDSFYTAGQYSNDQHFCPCA